MTKNQKNFEQSSKLWTDEVSKYYSVYLFEILLYLSQNIEGVLLYNANVENYKRIYHISPYMI